MTSGPARIVVDPDAGGRLASLAIDGLEVLVARDPDPMRWGSYPMVPFAGRVGRGRFRFDGREHRLPVNLEPHAIHGYGLTTPWAVVDERTLAYRLEPPWPFAGEVTQRFALEPEWLRVVMTLTAHERQPVVLGWHPWFRRRLHKDGPSVELDLAAASMYELDVDALPTGRLVEPPPGPWDNCFTGFAASPVLRWGRELSLRLDSSADHWVVFDEPTDAVCVEPQTAAPDQLENDDVVVEAGDHRTIELTITWD